MIFKFLESIIVVGELALPIGIIMGSRISVLAQQVRCIQNREIQSTGSGAAERVEYFISELHISYSYISNSKQNISLLNRAVKITGNIAGQQRKPLVDL